MLWRWLLFLLAFETSKRELHLEYLDHAKLHFQIINILAFWEDVISLITVIVGNFMYGRELLYYYYYRYFE